MKKVQISLGTMVIYKDGGVMCPMMEVAAHLDDNTVCVLTEQGALIDRRKADLIVQDNERPYQNSKKFLAENLEELYKNYMKKEDFVKVTEELSSDFLCSYLKEISFLKDTATFGTAKCIMMGVFSSLSRQHSWISKSDRCGKFVRKAKRTVSIS